jgi:hypothetical protein
MKKNWTNKLYIFTILLFTLGFLNMIFAWLGFACMTIPFFLLARDKKKTWCQGYCPRANLFTTLFQGRSLTGKAAPKWLIGKKAKTIVLIYFSFNLFILFMSTMMVIRGRMDAMEKVRFMIAFQLPWNMPQLLDIGFIPNWVVHLSFRVYSMMLTSTVLGLILGWMYRPRTWCAICPVNTISDIAFKK